MRSTPAHGRYATTLRPAQSQKMPSSRHVFVLCAPCRNRLSLLVQLETYALSSRAAARGSIPTLGSTASIENAGTIPAFSILVPPAGIEPTSTA